MDRFGRYYDRTGKKSCDSKVYARIGKSSVHGRLYTNKKQSNHWWKYCKCFSELAYETEAVVLNELGEEKRYLLDDLIEGLERNRLKEKEVLIRFIVKKDSSISGFSKVGSRKAVTISKINGCVKTVLKENILTQVIVYLGAVGAKSTRAGYIEQALEGQRLEEVDFRSLKEAVYAQIEANIPNRSSRHYKKSAAFGVLDTILEELKTQVREVKA